MKAKISKEGKVKEYNIIDSWNDVTLEKWQQLVLGKKESKTKEAKETIAILSDIPKKLIEQMALKDVSLIFERISKLQVDGKLKKIFEIDGIKYGFLPDCDEITLGEWADIEHYIKDGLEKNMHKIMAVLFRPITSKEDKMYSIEAYKDGRERAEKFRKKMTIVQINQALVFFWTFGSEFAGILPLYLTKKMLKLKAEISLAQSGGGSV